MSRQIVITGVSRGLGRAMVDQFVQLGHHVYGCATSDQQIAELQEQYPLHHFRVVDIARVDQVEAWATEVLQTSEPDLLVNNAAVINRSQPLWQVPPHEFHTLMQVNVTGTFHTIRAFLPHMLEKGTGVIVNFSSGWGRSTSPEVAPYCASKFAVEGLTKALAQEVSANVAIVALNPGIINTDMLNSCFGEGAATFPKPATWGSKSSTISLKFR